MGLLVSLVSLPSLTPTSTVLRTPVFLKKVFPGSVHTFSMLWLSSPSRDRCTLNSLSDLPCFLFLHSFLFWWECHANELVEFSSLSGLNRSSAVKIQSCHHWIAREFPSLLLIIRVISFAPAFTVYYCSFLGSFPACPNLFIFIWLLQVSIITNRIFSCSMWDLVP